MRNMKAAAIALVVMAVAACTPVAKRSVYPSGWSNFSSNETFRACAPYHLQKNMPIEHNLELLVTHGLLTQDQSQRVRIADVRVGDPECMVYAAYGLTTGSQTFFRGTKNDGLIQRSVAYWCANSEAPCPGVVVTIADGRVTNIRQATSDDQSKPPIVFH